MPEVPSWLGILSQIVVIVGALGALAIRLDKTLRAGPLTKLHDDIEAVRDEVTELKKLNCVHHSLIFEHSGIARDEVTAAERDAGVTGKVWS